MGSRQLEYVFLVLLSIDSCTSQPDAPSWPCGCGGGTTLWGMSIAVSLTLPHNLTKLVRWLISQVWWKQIMAGACQSRVNTTTNVEQDDD